jgi:hypothetical protein
MSELTGMLTGAPQRNNHRNPCAIPEAPLSTFALEHGAKSVTIL